METSFGSILAGLRHGSGLNQRQLAAELRISQALLSHYEKGSREPGLPFVCRVCDYFGVSADFILGRTVSAEGAASSPEKRALAALLDVRGDPALKDAAESYADASAARLAALLKGDAAGASRQALRMAEEELKLACAPRED